LAETICGRTVRLMHTELPYANQTNRTCSRLILTSNSHSTRCFSVVVILLTKIQAQNSANECKKNVKGRLPETFFFPKNSLTYSLEQDIRWRSCLRHYATSPKGHADVSCTYFFRPHYDPEVGSTSKRNQYQG